jgi:hypothetical protein
LKDACIGEQRVEGGSLGRTPKMDTFSAVPPSIWHLVLPAPNYLYVPS